MRLAVAWWAAAGLDGAPLARLRSLDVRVADLGGATLGESSGDVLWLDATAAGHGWSEGAAMHLLKMVTKPAVRGNEEGTGPTRGVDDPEVSR